MYEKSTLVVWHWDVCGCLLCGIIVAIADWYTNCVTFCKLLKLLCPSFLISKIENHILSTIVNLSEFLWELYEVTQVKDLEQCLAHNKCPITSGKLISPSPSSSFYVLPWKLVLTLKELGINFSHDQSLKIHQLNQMHFFLFLQIIIAFTEHPALS